MVGSVRWWWRWLRRNPSRNSAIVKSRSRRRQCCKFKKVPLVIFFFIEISFIFHYIKYCRVITCRNCGGSIFEVFVVSHPPGIYISDKKVFFVFLLKLKTDPPMKLHPKEWAKNPQTTKNCAPPPNYNDTTVCASNKWTAWPTRGKNMDYQKV